VKLFSYTFLIKLIAQSKFYADLHFEKLLNTTSTAVYRLNYGFGSK